MRVNLHVLLLFALLCVGCTRSVPGLTVTVGFGRNGQGGLAADDQLLKTVTAIRLENQAPIVREATYKKGDIPRGQDLSVELSQVPLGTPYLVQFLAIYENINNGALRYFYGSSQGEVQPSLVIEITADNIADTDRILRATGRYKNARGEFPSGQLSIEYLPPHQEPGLSITTLTLNDGWFSLQAPQVNSGTLRVVFGGEVVFPRLHPAAAEFANVSPRLLKIIKPLSFYLTPQGQVSPHPEADLYLGLWGAEDGQICYPQATETVTGEFTNPGLDLPLEFATATPMDKQIRPAGGGLMVNPPDPACTLLFDPQKVSEDVPFYH